MIVHNSIIKQVAHCDRNAGSGQNGRVAHSRRTDGSFGHRLFRCCTYSENLAFLFNQQTLNKEKRGFTSILEDLMRFSQCVFTTISSPTFL